jgi:NAD(P)-dependent dehydrogenase (short-subunit alcohol dehydrogenase family)/CBS domain-containing protein
MPVRLKSLREQTIVITGASSGNGLATAVEAVRRGAAVVIAARNGEALERIAADLRAEGGRVAICVADVAAEGDVERIAQTAIDAFGGFDSWVNDAAAAAYGRLDEVSMEDHRRIFDVNYFGLLQGMLVAARHLRTRGGGAVVNIGSVLSDRAMILQGPYSATKHAVQAATDAMRMELERDRAPVSVTLIKPASIHTPYPEHARNLMEAPPRLPPPLYDPRLVADAILFACEHPRRQLYVGGGGYAITLAGRLAPRLTDLVMEAFGVGTQQDRGDPGDPAARDNLYQPRSDGRIEGTQDVAVRRTSLLLEAQKRPWLAPFLLGAAGGEILASIGRRRSSPRSRFERRGAEQRPRPTVSLLPPPHQEPSHMKVSEIMSSDVEVVSPEQPIQEAARLMLQADAGVVPVQDGDKLIGMLTDRDIAVRAVAEGRGPDTPVSEVMTGKPLFCFDDDDADEVSIKMGDAQVRRMPVLSRQGEKLVGIVSLGDLTKVEDEGQAASVALEGVSQEGGEHNQSREG